MLYDLLEVVGAVMFALLGLVGLAAGALISRMLYVSGSIGMSALCGICAVAIPLTVGYLIKTYFEQ